MLQRGLPPRPVLGADTEVVLDGTIFGKPKDDADAVRMLTPLVRPHAPGADGHRAVLGREHGRRDLDVDRDLSRASTRDEIERYVATGEPFDKAGAYADPGPRRDRSSSRIEGSHSGVMGLPLYETAQALAGSASPCCKDPSTRRSPRQDSDHESFSPMSHEILINVTPQETRVAMLEQGVVQELHIERASARGLVGNICLGRVARVLPGMQSAFVEIGLERAAFLHIADIWEHRQNGHGGADTRPIEKILHEGQSLLVQVIKDPIGTKGARLSTQVSLAGRLLVYLPQDSHIGISQRIEDEAEREILRGKLQLLLPDGHAGGFIIRTMAETATEREMQSDIEYLTKLWGDLNARARDVPAPALLYQDLNLAQRVLARHVHRGDFRASSSTRARRS